MTIYCDSCILIYYFDHTGPWNQRAKTHISRLLGDGDIIATGDLVRLECRVKPMVVKSS